MADGAKPPKGLLIAGIVLLILGIGGCGYGCTNFVGFVGDLADVAEGRSATPYGQSTTLQSDAGGAVVLTSSNNADCEVVDDSGNAVTLQEPSPGTSGSVDTTDGASLELQYFFETDSGVTYEVTCQDGFNGGSGEFVVVGFDIGKIVGGLLGIGIGAVLFIIGVILLIIGLVQRSKWKKRQGPGGPSYGTAPGGYAPPAPGTGSSSFGAPGGPGAPAPPMGPGPQQPGYPQPGYPQPGYPPAPGAPQGPGPSGPPPPPSGPSSPPPGPSGPSGPPPPPPPPPH